MMDNFEYTKSEPDWLDIRCSLVFSGLLGLDIDDQINVLEQCLDYARMEKLEIE